MEEDRPAWSNALDAEDWHFMKRFLLTSGSLKALAEEYGISYPTVRSRLDRLIAKVEAADAPGARDAFHRQVRILVADGRLDRGLARKLLSTHRQVMKEQGTAATEGATSHEA
ncbi:MAG TPA: DUF2089 family protein [Candidatus Hydrogenedentes bacterium]|nr:DUF2089 family protein [Candidatus Hydrogenedentota bacterium]